MKTQSNKIVAGALCALAFTAATAHAEVEGPKPAPRAPHSTGDVKTTAPAVVKSTGAARNLAPIADTNAIRHTAPAPAVDPLGNRVAYADDAQGTWAASARFKARMSAESTTFVPFFGSDKPRSAPLVFTTRSIRAAGQPIANVLGAIARDGDRVSIERGAVDERWQFSPQGAEQLFVIDSPLANGDVVVRVGFEGEYSARADEEGILFTGELGRVRYGKAVAIDAAGARVAVSEQLVDGAIELVVPSSFLAGATYPVTIDPLVSTYYVESATDHAVSPDVAYEAGAGQYLYVWEKVFNSSDHDVYARFGDDNGPSGSPMITIDSSATNWAHPSVASNRLAQNFLVVAEVGPDGQREIRGRRVDSTTGAVGATIIVQGASSSEKFHPVVGGDPSLTGPTFYCVAWERAWSTTDHDIQAAIVDPSEAGVVQPMITVDNSVGTLDAWPSISKCDGSYPFTSQAWTIVWERAYSSTDGDVYGSQIAWDGQIVEPTFVIDSSSNDDRRPAVSSILDGGLAQRAYVAVWTRLINPGDHDIIAATLVGDVRTDSIDVTSALPLPTNDDITPRIDGDGHLFALTWSKNWAPSDNDVFADFLYVSGGTLGIVGDLTTIAASGVFEWNPSITSKHSGGSGSNRFSVACERYSGTQMDIYAGVFSAPTSVPVESYCAGLAATCPCGNGGAGVGGCANSANAAGAILSATGEALVSADTFRVTSSGMPPTTTCLFFQGTNPLNSPWGVTFGDGLRCVGGTIVRLGTKTASNGTAFYPALSDAPIATKGLLSANGGARYYQAWYRNAANFCTASTFNLSNALRATWLP